MGRRNKRKRRQRATVSSPAATASTPTAGHEGGADGSERFVRIVPWRERMQAVLDALREYTRHHHAAAVEQMLATRLGTQPEVRIRADVVRLVDDFAATPGSAGDTRSIAGAFAAEGADLEEIERAQLRRLERERRRGVFVVQRASRKSLSLWDPLEGAPLTLHLLTPQSAEQDRGVARGAIVSTSYQPWIARLVAVGGVELFGGSEALTLFRREVLQSGRTWHPLPPLAPVAARRQSRAAP